MSSDDRARVDQHLGECEVCAKTARLLSLQKTLEAGSLPSTLGLAPTMDSDRGEEVSHSESGEQTVFLTSEGRYQNPDGGIVELGSGGLGRVLSVHDAAFGREVALKEIASGPQVSDAARVRFMREARLAGQLEHPGIVPVYDFAADASGRLFYVMRRIVGRTLAELIGEAPALSDRLALVPHVLAMGQALAYAHSRGVVHRDVKPQNVMVGPFGETLLLDWGLGRARQALRPEAAASDDTAVSRKGVPFGTPAYMSPEQAHGILDEVDERSDVWMLGATLFHVLTGRPPYAEATLETALTKARGGEVPAVTALQPNAPPELAAVVARCVAATKADRYPSMLLLVRDLEAWFAGRRVSAYEYSASELARRFARTWRLPLAVTGTLLIAGAVAVGVLEAGVRRERDDYRALSMMVLGDTVEALRQTPGKRQVVVELANKVRETLERGTWVHASLEDRHVLHTAVFTSGCAQLEAGHLAEAEQSLLHAIALSDSLLKDAPTAEVLATGALDRSNLAATLQLQNRVPEADRQLDESLAMIQRGRTLDPKAKGLDNAEELTLSFKIAVAADQGRYLEAIPWAERGLELQKVRFAGQELRARDHYNEVLGYDQLSEMCQEAGQHDPAAKAVGKAFEALARFEERFPSSVDYSEAAADLRMRAALLAFEEGDRPMALAHLAEGAKFVDRLIQTEPENPDYLSRGVVYDYFAGSLDGMRARLRKLEALGTVESASDLIIPAMVVVWSPEKVLEFEQQHPELVTRDTRLHLTLAAALAGHYARASELARALDEEKQQAFHWSPGVLAQRLLEQKGLGAEAVLTLARALDSSVAPRDPAKRREALRSFGATMATLATAAGPH